MLQEPKIRVAISTFAKFCASDDQMKQRSIVGRTKNAGGKSGGDYYQGFRRILKTACQMGQDIYTVECDLARLIAKEEGPKKERLSLLRDTFLSQWRGHDYQFFGVQRTIVTVDRLTITVSPELGILTPNGSRIAVRLWLSKDEVLDRERNTFIYLMSEAKIMAQWPPAWRFGVWELERGEIDHEMMVTEELRNFTHKRAVKFAEIWDASPG